jgi:hypothetical protein
MGSSLSKYWKRSFGFVIGIASDDGVLDILGNSLCAAGQMIEQKRLSGQWVVFELQIGRALQGGQK